MGEAPIPNYQDDPTIGHDVSLWRRVNPIHFVKENNGTVRPSSAAFQDHPNGTPMSVVIAAECTIERALAGYTGFGIVAITAGLARQYGQGIMRTPQPNEPAHADVFGPKPKNVTRSLAKGSVWVVPRPTDEELW